MRFLSYSVGPYHSFGLVDGSRVFDIGARSRYLYKDLKSFIEAGALLSADRFVSGDAEYSLADIRFEPVVPNPDKILCVGLNYEEHRLETKQPRAQHPTIFLRTPGSQVGHGRGILLPPESERFDFEAEIAVIIGKRGRRISQEAALDFVAGYSCYNDGTIRDWQVHTPQWVPGKNFYQSGSFGPWLTTPDEYASSQPAKVEARLNGTVMQSSTSDMMIFSIPEIIAYVSRFTELLPGDVIATGTPGGVGARREPPVWMKAGDVIEIEVSGVGTLSNTVVSESANG